MFKVCYIKTNAEKCRLKMQMRKVNHFFFRSGSYSEEGQEAGRLRQRQAQLCRDTQEQEKGWGH